MSHSHHHEVINYNKAFGLGIGLNVLFVIIEVIYGLMADSLALLADAGHNFSDVLGLLLAWGAYYLAKRRPTKQHTYGLRKVTILSALLSAVLLLVALGGIVWESVERFTSGQQQVNSTLVITVATIGVLINTLTALLFVKDQHKDLNIRGAYLHMAADAAVSVGVVVAGIIIMFTGWQWIDPVISLLIVVGIFLTTWQLLNDSINLALDGVPKGVDMQALETYLLDIEQVSSLHALHVWGLSTTETALSVHLVMKNKTVDNDLLDMVRHHLHDHYNIEYVTIQMEYESEKYRCLDA